MPVSKKLKLSLSSWFITGLLLFLTVSINPPSSFLIHPALAATNCTWDNSDADNNWNNANNWSCGSVPDTTTELAIFDGTSDTNCNLDVTPITLGGFQMNSGYNSTVDLGSATITLEAGNWTVSSGTVDDNTSTVVFSYPSKWDTGTITGSHTLNNVTLNFGGSANSLTINSGDTLTVVGTLTMQGSGKNNLQDGTIEAQGDITITSTYEDTSPQKDATIHITGTANQTLTGSGTAKLGSLPHVNIDKTGGTLTLASVITTTGNWAYTQGTVDDGSSTVVFSMPSNYNAETITGSHTLNNAIFDFGGASNVLTVASGTTLTADGTLTIQGAGKPRIDTGTIAAKGHITTTNTYTHTNSTAGTGTIEIGGGAAQDLTGSGTAGQGAFANININKDVGTTLTLKSTITVSGDWTLTQGIVDATTNDSTVVFYMPTRWEAYTIDNDHTLDNVIFDFGGSNNAITIASGDTVTVAGDLTIAGAGRANINTGTIDVEGNITVTNTGTTAAGSGTINIDGTGDQVLAGSGTAGQGELPKIIINKAVSGTLYLSDVISTTGNWTYTAGTVDADGNADPAATASTVAFADADITVDSNGMSFYNVTLNSTNSGHDTFLGSAIDIDGTLTIAESAELDTTSSDHNVTVGAFSMTGGIFDAFDSTVACEGDWSVTGGTFDRDTSELQFTGSTTPATFTPGSGQTYENVTINKDSTTDVVQLSTDTLTMDSSTAFTITQGVLNLNGIALDVGSSSTVSIANNGTLQLIGTESLSNYTHDTNTGTITYTGTGTYAGLNSDIGDTFQNLTFNGSGGVWDLGAATTINNNLTITAGTLDLDGQNLTVTGILSNDDTLRLQGGETTVSFGTFDSDSGTIVYDGTGATGLKTGNNYYDLTFNGTSTPTWTLNAALDVNNDLTIAASNTLDVSTTDYTITVGQNFANSGTFTDQEGTITFDDASKTTVISGTNTFYTLNSTTANKTIQFPSGVTTTIDNNLNIVGTTNPNEIDLHSDSTPSAWNLCLNGTYTIDYANVKDSIASCNAIVPTNSTDASNNTGWFNTAPLGGYTANNTIPQAQVSQSTDGNGIMTVTFRVQDGESDSCTSNTFEYSVDGGSTWNAPTNNDSSQSIYISSAGDNWSTNAGSNYSSATDWSGTQHTFKFNTKHADVSGINNTNQTDIQIRFTVNDGTADSASPATSASFEVDNLNPTTNTTTAFASSPVAGDTTISLSGSITETNPNTNIFYYNLNAAGYDAGTAGDTNTANPSNQSISLGVTLDGNDYFSAIKIVHTDDYGNQGTNENTTAVYVKPYTPSAPTITNPSGTTIDITINKHSSETTGLKYAIAASNDSWSTTQYVQADNTLNTSTIWQTRGNWDNSYTITITGLSTPVSNYQFKIKSRNSSDDSTESDLSTAASSSNTAPSAPTNLQVETQTNPTGITDSTPEFTAVFDDTDTSGEYARYYQIQVIIDGGNFSSPLWDSTQTQLSEWSPGVAENAIISEISYGGTALAFDGIKYYWKIKFWDDDNVEGSWSNGTASFTMDNPPIGGYSENNTVPEAQISQTTNGNGIITVQFKIQDPESDNCTLNTFQFSSNNGDDWNTPTNNDSSESLYISNSGDNWSTNADSNYSSATDWSGITHSFKFNTKHADVMAVDDTNLESTRQTDIKIRFTVNDGNIDSSSVTTSETFEIDNAVPVVYTTVHLEDLTPNAGATPQVDVAFTENNPNTNEYNYKLGTDDDYNDWTTGDSNIADPEPISFSNTTLKGNNYIDKIKARHTDDFGNVTTSELETNFYVIPYTPLAPTTSNILGYNVNVTINKHSNEATDLEYALAASNDNWTTSQYVQADGTLDTSEIWQTLTSWGANNTITITTSSDTANNYRFKTKSRNSADNSTESSLSDSSIDPTSDLYTSPNIPEAPTLSSPTTTTLNLVINTNSNNNLVTYSIYETTQELYIQADGTLDTTEVYQTYTTWGSTSGKTISGLSINTAYTFKVKAKNILPTSDWSSTTTLYTLANPPGTPTQSSLAASSFTLTLDINNNPSDTLFLIQETTTSQYLQADGTLDESAVWQTNANWGGENGLSITGLSANTQYTFVITAKNGDSTETTSSSLDSFYTLSNTPGTPSIPDWDIHTTYLRFILNSNNNPASTQFTIYEEETNQFLQGSGLLDATAAWHTYTGWGDSDGISITNLTPGTSYSFKVKARNGDLVSTDWSETSMVAVPTSEVRAQQPSSGGGGGGSGGSSSPRSITTPSAPSIPYELPDTSTSRELTVKKSVTLEKTEGNIPRPIKLVNEGENLAINIPKDTEIISISNNEKFTGTIDLPTRIDAVALDYLPRGELADDEVIQIGDLNQKFTKPVEIQIPISEEVWDNVSYDRSRIDIMVWRPYQVITQRQPWAKLVTSTNLSNGEWVYYGNGSDFIDSEGTLKIDITFSTLIAFRDNNKGNGDYYEPAGIGKSSPFKEKSTEDESTDESTEEKTTTENESTDEISQEEIVLHPSQPEPEPETSPYFSDLVNHWATNYINRLYLLKAIQGKKPEIFDPDSPITRAEFLKITILGLRDTKTDINTWLNNILTSYDSSFHPFPDISHSNWYFPYITYAQEKSIVEGYPDGNFYPNTTINRAEALKVLLETFGRTKIQNGPTGFPNVDENAWYADYIRTAIKIGVVDEFKSNGTFNPATNLTRAEAAKIIIRMRDFQIQNRLSLLSLK